MDLFVYYTYYRFLKIQKLQYSKEVTEFNTSYFLSPNIFVSIMGEGVYTVNLSKSIRKLQTSVIKCFGPKYWAPNQVTAILVKLPFPNKNDRNGRNSRNTKFCVKTFVKPVAKTKANESSQCSLKGIIYFTKRSLLKFFV